MKLYKARVSYGMILVVAPDALRALQIIHDKIQAKLLHSGDWLSVLPEDLEEIPLDVESIHSAEVDVVVFQ